jgi:hypothetical protein
MFEQVALASPLPCAAEGTLLSVSCPGGMARQFRVQVTSTETPSGWSLAGSFCERSLAQAHADELARTGQSARVVCCQSLPTAA